MLKVQFQDQGDTLDIYISEIDMIVKYIEIDGIPVKRKYVGGKCLNLPILEKGGKLMVSMDGIPATIKYPIDDITEIPVSEFNHVRRGVIKGYLVFDDGQDIEIIIAQDVPGKTASDLWRTDEVVRFKKSFLVPEKPEKPKRKKAMAVSPSPSEKAVMRIEMPARLTESKPKHEPFDYLK